MAIDRSTNGWRHDEKKQFDMRLGARTSQRSGFASIRLRLFVALILGIGLMAQAATAANLQLGGSSSWQISGSSISIVAGSVSNDSTSGTSGSIRLQIWATSSPFTGGTIQGYVLGTRNLNPLSAGYYYSGVSGSVSYLPPPSGSYYTTLTVEEFTGSGFVIRDFLNFNGTSQLGGGGGGAGTGAIELSGSVGWTVSNTKIDIRAGTVSNNRTGGVSGTLRLQIWATSTPYNGGTINGYVLGTRSLGTLAGNRYLSNVSGFVPYDAPPSGIYFTTITLEEFTSSGFVILDYATFDSSTTFGGSSGGGIGGGGGGSGTGLQLIGFSSFKISTKKGVTLKVEEILNDRISGVSGSLRLRLWATSTPYTGGPINGYVLATRDVGQLAAGYYFSNLSGTVPYSRPPKGTYFLTLTLEEYAGSYVIVDYLTFSKTSKLK